MAILAANNYVLEFSNGLAARTCLYALRMVTTGDTVDLGAEFQAVKQAIMSAPPSSAPPPPLSPALWSRCPPGSPGRRLPARLGRVGMSGTLYWVQNAAYPTTAAPVKVATGAAIKTLLQIGIPSTVAIRVVEWGISFDTPASASIIACELFGCTGAASTGTSITPVEYGSLQRRPIPLRRRRRAHLLLPRHRRHRRRLPPLRLCSSSSHPPSTSNNGPWAVSHSQTYPRLCGSESRRP